MDLQDGRVHGAGAVGDVADGEGQGHGPDGAEAGDPPLVQLQEHPQEGKPHDDSGNGMGHESELVEELARHEPAAHHHQGNGEGTQHHRGRGHNHQDHRVPHDGTDHLGVEKLLVIHQRHGGEGLPAGHLQIGQERREQQDQEGQDDGEAEIEDDQADRDRFQPAELEQPGAVALSGDDAETFRFRDHTEI